MEKLWGLSFQSSQPVSLVGKKDICIRANVVNSVHNNRGKRNCLCCYAYHNTALFSGTVIIWQVLQTLATCHSRCLVSILSSALALAHWTTRRNTPKQQVWLHIASGNAIFFIVTKLTWMIIRWFLPSSLSVSRGVLSFYLFNVLFFSTALLAVPGAEKAQLYTLRTAKALAMTAVDVVCCPDLLRQVREDFRLAKLTQETADEFEGCNTAPRDP